MKDVKGDKVQAYLAPDQKLDLKGLVAVDGISQSAVICTALTEYFTRRRAAVNEGRLLMEKKEADVKALLEAA